MYGIVETRGGFVSDLIFPIIRPKDEDDELEKLIFGKEGRRTVTKEVREISVDQLHAHPKNELIYGQNEDVTDLKDHIAALGYILDSLKVTDSNVIISGHRRWKAAIELGMLTVPCEVVNFDSPEEELAALVLYNYKRNKTNEQKAREGIALSETLSVEAVQRRLAALNQHRTVMDESSITSEADNKSDSDTSKTPNNTIVSEVGLTRDKVATALGLSSGKTFERMRDVLIKADALKESGNTNDSELLITVLNRRPSAAKDLLGVPLESLTEEDRENIRTGKVAPRRFLTQNETGNDDKKPKRQSSYNKALNEAKALGVSVESLKKTISRVKNHNEQLEIRDSLQIPIDEAVKLRMSLAGDPYDDFLDIGTDFATTISSLSEALPDLLDTEGLSACKTVVEDHIEELQDLLLIIESGLTKETATKTT